MFYTRILLILGFLLLVGCSTPGPVEQSAPSEDVSTNESEIELQLYQQAITYLNYGELDKAEEILLEFHNDHPDLAGPIANLGLIALKRDDIEQAEAYFNNALENNPKLPQALNLLGVIEQKKGNIKQAESLYSKAINEKEDYAVAHYNLALLSDIYLGKIRRAVTHYRRYLELIDEEDPETASWLEELEYTLEESGL